MQFSNSPVIFLMGPTAVGKTDLAMALHAKLPVDIVSVDSSQVYRGMDIGTAKPTQEERAVAPHRLIDIRDPAEPYSAAQFRDDALREIAAIVQAGRIPLLVGGSMLYFRALADGLAPMPPADPMVRARITREANDAGWASLHRRLAESDPNSAARIGANDAQRIQRALEIIELTGETPTVLKQRQQNDFPYRVIKLALWPAERATLHERIERRFDAMLARGLLAEVEKLYRRGDLDIELPSVRTVGYRQIWLYLTGKLNYLEMVVAAKAATRQLAKRQLTWIRHAKDVMLIDCFARDLPDTTMRLLDGRLGS